MLLIFNNIKIGLNEIKSNPMRSFLTMIGIILGVASLVLNIGIVEGMFTFWEKILKQRGGLSVITIKKAEVPHDQESIKSRSKGLRYDDLDAILNNIENVVGYSARVGTRTLLSNMKSFKKQPVNGVAGDYFNIDNIELKNGELFNDLDNKLALKKVIIGSDIRQNIFGRNINVIGEELIIDGKVFTIIGELEEVGKNLVRKNRKGRSRNFMSWRNRGVYIPYNTFQKNISQKEVDEIKIKIENPDNLENIVDKINKVLTIVHHGIEDFTISTNLSSIQHFEEQKKISSYVMGGIAGIALVIGGVGIMNVMLASISERIREIGVRKAVGATGTQIFGQFIIESATLSFIAGILGIFLSIGLVYLMKYMLEFTRFNPVITSSALILGFIISVSIGLIAGIYPALKASRLDPIKALHHE